MARLVVSRRTPLGEGIGGLGLGRTFFGGWVVGWVVMVVVGSGRVDWC